MLKQLKLVLTGLEEQQLKSAVCAAISSFVTRKPNCRDCEHSSFGHDEVIVCQLAGVTPPPEVIENGCPKFDYDDIPF